jgi:hypothetical protein
VGKLRQTMEKVRALAGAAGGQTGTAASSGRLTVKKTSTIGAQWDPTPWQLQAFETNTEASFTQTQFYKARLQDDEADLKKLGTFFEKRRPISAPHTRQTSNTVTPITLARFRNMSWILNIFHRRPHAAVAKELLPPGDADRERTEPLQRFRAPGFSLTKVLPLSGVLCFGAYCNFDTRARVSRKYFLTHFGVPRGANAEVAFR